MKLRIQENSLRLRLTQKEVAQLHDHGLVECAIRFSPGSALRYRVASSPGATTVSVTYEGDSVAVVLPVAVATAWAESSEITIEGPDSGVQILIEKDFQCLHKPEDRDPDGYPNPLAHDHSKTKKTAGTRRIVPAASPKAFRRSEECT